jgi:enoyl-CoA hydratase/carnithine racemase
MSTLLIDDSHPGIRILTLNRPERLNALDGPSLENILAAVHECSAPGKDIRVIVIRAAGRAFCAGADLKWLASGVLADDAAHQRFQDQLQAMCETLEATDQVVIASVHGFALAGGMELTLSCDIVVAAEDAELGDEHIRRNLLPGGGGSQRLPRKLGLARGLYYLLSGRRIRGREAERMGLVSVAVAAAELPDATLALAQEIARTDGRALANMKQLVRRGMEMPLRDGLWLERWMQHRYRNESSAMDSGVANFASHGKDAGRTTA